MLNFYTQRTEKHKNVTNCCKIAKNIPKSQGFDQDFSLKQYLKI